MSKKNFSIKINDMISKKIKALNDLNIEEFLRKDKYFEFILCLSYMTLSKEKIIDKDMKNTDRLERLTKHVSTLDIDYLFSPSFSKNLPIINYARENDNLWILDNIRDSIMHECFIIDEENENIVINNTAHDRELNAIIPFSWFVKYAKNDILSKKISDYHIIRGFYYNQTKKDCNYITTNTELNNTIFYTVRVTGDVFNTGEIENRINELFNELSKNSTEDYQQSYYHAKYKVKEIINKEFPNLQIEIFTNAPNKKLRKKLKKQTQDYYKNYDIYYESINNIIKQKSNELLKYIKRIIEKLDTKFDKNADTSIEQMELINFIMNEDSVKYTNSKEVYEVFQNNLKTLRNILINIYGVSTLVINHDNLYNKSFGNVDPQAYRLLAYSKKSFEDFVNLKKTQLINILKKKVILFEKEEHLKKCSSEEGIEKLTSLINDIKEEIKELEEKYKEYVYFRPYIPKYNEKRVNYINSQITKYIEMFNNCNSIEEKNKTIKIISGLIDRLDEYVYGYCDMEEAIRIIRNSFSHIGRIYIGKDKEKHTTIILNDYSNNQKTGQVLCSLDSLFNILSKPLKKRKQLSKRL